MLSFFLLSAILTGLLSRASLLWPQDVGVTTRQSPYINNTGLTDLVGWDPYSFFIQGKRVYIQAGEFHGFRLPVIPLWRDIMQKAKAAGLNTISIYTHWALMNPKEGIVDLEGVNDLQPLFDAAKEAGLWIIARPGPYINSETSAGGVPGHVLTLPGDTPWNLYNGILRSNHTTFHNAWQDYVNAVVPIIAKNQITEGGPVIMVQLENEYYNGAGQNEYILELKDAFLRLGIVVPTTHNDPGMYRNLINEPDIYAFDQYPLSFDCTNPNRWRDISTLFRQYHEEVMPNVPLMIPEYQGGAFSKRGLQTNENCREMTNPNSQRVLNYQMWASGSTAVSFYMFYGGTNWGQLPYPVAETTYDFAAPIAESRELTVKYDELKLQSIFLRSFPDFRYTELQAEDNITIPGVMSTHLKNPESGANFFVYRHTNISNWSTLEFKDNVGEIEADLVLPGRDSIIAVANLVFGTHSKLIQSTASLFSQLSIDGKDVLIAYGFNDTTYEITLALDSEPDVKTFGAPIESTYSSSTKSLTLSLQNESGGLRTIQITSGNQQTIVIFADYSVATRFWMPSIAGSDSNFGEYVDIAATTPVLVRGPYLVRTATIEGSTLSLTGDTSEETELTVLASSSISQVTWNGNNIALSTSEWGALIGKVGGVSDTWTIPDLKALEWYYANSLPEISPSFDDSGLTVADHTNTTSTFPPYYGKPWVLYADDYGYHSGNLLWRGTFEHGNDYIVPSAVNLSISGGQHFAASVWLNENYLGPSYVPNAPTTNTSFPISEELLRNGTNYVTVLQDHMGHNLAGQTVCCTPGGRQRDLQQPKGLQGYYLEGREEDDQFTGWKLTGNFGGEDYPDKSRKILNEGGLYGERAGWHLPGFDHNSWEKKAPWDGLDKPGVGWFRTTFTLDIPSGHDVHLSIVFPSTAGHYRAQLYVNGWQLGKRIANLGPQTSFVVQEGILNYHGEVNTLAVSLWALEDKESDLKIPSLELVQTGRWNGGVGAIEMAHAGWSELRAD